MLDPDELPLRSLPPGPVSEMDRAELLGPLPKLAREINVETLTDDQLLGMTEYIRRNTGRADPITYDWALAERYLPELLRRFERMIRR